MRNLSRSFLPAGLAVLLSLAAFNHAHSGEKKDIVETAIAAGSFNTLAAALQAGDLVEPLQGEGPFTVFAPTDEAFSKLPEGTLDGLLKPENKSKLVSILAYHVVPGDVRAADVVKLSYAGTLNGQRVDIKADGGTVMIDNAQVVKADIACTNGVIHVIDSVILPATDDIPTTAAKAGAFNTLLTAVEAAGLAEALSGSGPFTVFAPTDEAFAKLPDGTLDSLLKPANRETLAGILKYHVVSGRVYSDQALQAGEAKTLQGAKVAIRATGDGAKVNKATLVATDIEASNGVVHVIDSVLLPPKDNRVGAAETQRMIEETVARGVRLSNRGYHSACSRLYESTAKSIIDGGADIPPAGVAHLQWAVRHAARTHCVRTKVRTLRRGLDAAYASLSR